MEINVKILNLKFLYGDCDREDEARYNRNVRISKVVLRKERGNSGGEALNGGRMKNMAIWRVELEMPVLNRGPLSLLNMANVSAG